MEAEDTRLEEGREEAGGASGGLEETVAGLTDALASKDRELADLRDTLSRAVGKYRDLVVAAASGVPQELISGETIEAIDASLATASELVNRVKASLEDQAKNAAVPAGAPAREQIALSGLSPSAKIQYGLKEKRR